MHVETEAFNIEKWHHKDVYMRYCEILSEQAHAPDALRLAGEPQFVPERKPLAPDVAANCGAARRGSSGNSAGVHT
jgi:hypothetical protein